MCSGDTVEDEFHVLMECPVYELLRRAVAYRTGYASGDDYVGSSETRQPFGSDSVSANRVITGIISIC